MADGRRRRHQRGYLSPNFYEGGINLSRFPQFANWCFTSFILDTRSSQSPTATLFDYAQGDIG